MPVAVDVADDVAVDVLTELAVDVIVAVPVAVLVDVGVGDGVRVEEREFVEESDATAGMDAEGDMTNTPDTACIEGSSEPAAYDVIKFLKMTLRLVTLVDVRALDACATLDDVPSTCIDIETLETTASGLTSKLRASSEARAEPARRRVESVLGTALRSKALMLSPVAPSEMPTK